MSYVIIYAARLKTLGSGRRIDIHIDIDTRRINDRDRDGGIDVDVDFSRYERS